jgi:hypothetical protein
MTKDESRGRNVLNPGGGIVMQVALRFSSVALAIALAAACSNPPSRAPAAIAPAQSSSGASVPDLPPDAAASQTDIDKAMRKRGYQPALLRGERVYCRNEMLTGSNLESKVCLTARQIEELERGAKDILMGPRPAACPPKTAC